MSKSDKYESRVRRHKRIRKKIQGTAERPRLAVYKSNHYVYAQLIDDVAGVTLASASSLEASVRNAHKACVNVKVAAAIGKTIGERALAKGIKSVVFDRGGYIYHGRVKSLADAAREAGLEF